MPGASAKAPTCISEPLNYIDVWSRMQIEELLLAFQPTMLFVEHDETFRQGVATETITIPCG